MPTTRNRSIDILRTMAIILMVYGHYGALPVTTLLEFYFPLYSFHMPLFLFISGYLFHEFSAKEYGSFVWKKTLHIALPLIGCNILYAGILTLINIREVTNYFPSIEKIWTFHNLCVEPFICGHQYSLNLGTWFAGMLYVALLVYGLVFIATKRLPEWVMLIIYFCVAVLGLYYAQSPHPHWVMLPLHVSQALFYIHFGRCFKAYIEPFISRFNDQAVLLLLLLLWFVVLRFGHVPYVMVWMNYGGQILVPLLAAAAGCMFWKKLSDRIAYYVRPNRLEQIISGATWQIMTHHLFVRFLLNWTFVYILNNDSVQQEMFRNDFWYKVPACYFPLDICLTVGLPVLLYMFKEWTKKNLTTNYYRGLARRVAQIDRT